MTWLCTESLKLLWTELLKERVTIQSSTMKTTSKRSQRLSASNFPVTVAIIKRSLLIDRRLVTVHKDFTLQREHCLITPLRLYASSQKNFRNLY